MCKWNTGFLPVCPEQEGLTSACFQCMHPQIGNTQECCVFSAAALSGAHRKSFRGPFPSAHACQRADHSTVCFCLKHPKSELGPLKPQGTPQTECFAGFLNQWAETEKACIIRNDKTKALHWQERNAYPNPLSELWSILVCHFQIKCRRKNENHHVGKSDPCKIQINEFC